MRSYKTPQTTGGRALDLRPKRPGGNSDGRYNSEEYKRVRKAQLERFPYCQARTHCNGARATQAGHIKPISGPGDPGLADPSNIISTCASCNVGENWTRRKRKRKKQ